MTPAQVAFCAESIVDTLYGMGPDDLNLCFRMVLCGDFGEIYNRVDQPTIFGWIKKYQAKKAELAMRMNDNASQSNNIYDIFHNETMHKVLTEVHDKLKHKEQPAPAEYKQRERHPIEVRIEAEWDYEVKMGNVLYAGSTRMIDVNGVPMTYTEFYNHRFIQLTEE
jgi:hypothetical protein